MVPQEDFTVLSRGAILTGGRQHILDGGILSSKGGKVAYLGKAVFLDGGIIPSRGGVIRLEGGITPSEGGRKICGRRDASIGSYSPEGGNISSEGAECLRKATRRHISDPANFFGGRHLPFLGRHGTSRGLYGASKGRQHTF